MGASPHALGLSPGGCLGGEDTSATQESPHAWRRGLDQEERETEAYSLTLTGSFATVPFKMPFTDPDMSQPRIRDAYRTMQMRQ